MTELDNTLSITPDHYRANLLRGRILALQGNPLGGLNNLERATQIQPDSKEAHLFLAEAYAQLGGSLMLRMSEQWRKNSVDRGRGDRTKQT